MTPFSIFDDVNHVTQSIALLRGDPSTNFKFIPYLDVEIPGGGLHTPPCTHTIAEKGVCSKGFLKSLLG